VSMQHSDATSRRLVLMTGAAVRNLARSGRRSRHTPGWAWPASSRLSPVRAAWFSEARPGVHHDEAAVELASSAWISRGRASSRVSGSEPDESAATMDQPSFRRRRADIL
jgi:hypothetical protein